MYNVYIKQEKQDPLDRSVVQRRTRETGEPGYIQENQGYTGEPVIQENQGYTREPEIYRRTRDMQENQRYTGEPEIYRRTRNTGEPRLQVNQGIYRRTRDI